MTNPEGNGHAPVDLAHVEHYAERAAERLRAQATELRALLDDEDRVQAMLRTKLDESKARQTALRRAVEALDPTSKETKQSASRRRALVEATTPRGKTYARPSVDTLERVLAMLCAEDGAVSIDTLNDHGSGVSRDTVRRAVYALRDDGRVRVAGRGPSGGNLYAPMPEELDSGVDDDERSISVLSKAAS